MTSFSSRLRSPMTFCRISNSSLTMTRRGPKRNTVAARPSKDLALLRGACTVSKNDRTLLIGTIIRLGIAVTDSRVITIGRNSPPMLVQTKGTTTISRTRELLTTMNDVHMLARRQAHSITDSDRLNNKASTKCVTKAKGLSQSFVSTSSAVLRSCNWY